MTGGIAATPIVTSSPIDSSLIQQSYTGPKPTLLLVLDGWGIGPKTAGNAIAAAKTPNIDGYWISYPHTQLAASGQAVGLPQGEDGNTETGHLNIEQDTLFSKTCHELTWQLQMVHFFQRLRF